MQQPVDARPERPPNYLTRSIIVLVLLVPLCLLIGGSSVYTTWSVLTGPPVRSESPVWYMVFFELIRVVAALIGIFLPITALVQAVKVNTEYDAGNYGGAAAASKAAARHSRESIMILVIMLLLMGADLLRYSASRSN